jgi:hypothetical protein
MSTVWTFFYGSYMNFDVLREVNLLPAQHEVAQLDGFDIRIAPRANLVRSDRDSVWGVLATATHAELARLYAHAHDILGETYLPEAVLTRTAGGTYRPALCYICPHMEPGAPDPAYVERIVRPAVQLGFPAWYIDKLRSFATSTA